MQISLKQGLSYLYDLHKALHVIEFTAMVLHIRSISGSNGDNYEDDQKLKAKAVPLHTTKALGRRRGIAPTHSRPRHQMR
jgi:hypothetical protein